MKKITIACSCALTGVLFASCMKQAAPVPTAQTSSTTAANSQNPQVVKADANTTLPQSAFNLWGSCDPSAYDISGTNGICVPVGSTDCAPNDQAAQQSSGQVCVGMTFTGCFKGGSNAPSSANEMAIFLADNVTSWNGQEMGFVETLSDHTLKGYIQGGGNYYYQTISTGDNGYHTFTCEAESGDHTKVDFYVDGTFKFTLQNSGNNYYGNYYYWVGTTHRITDNWSSTGQQIEMYSMSVF